MPESSSRLKTKLAIVLIPLIFAVAICALVYRILSPTPVQSDVSHAKIPVVAAEQPAPTPSSVVHATGTQMTDTATDATPEHSVKNTALKNASSEEDLLVAIKKDLFTDPERTLRLSREGKTRFARSEKAPDFNFYEIRSLVELKRFDEAIAETDAMVERYPGNPLAEDARRHLRSHPMGQPPHVHENN